MTLVAMKMSDVVWGKARSIYCTVLIDCENPIKSNVPTTETLVSLPHTVARAGF